MFYSLVLHLYIEKDIAITHHLGRGLHGLFYYLLKRCDAAYASLIHDNAHYRPFTVSPLTVLELPADRGNMPWTEICSGKPAAGGIIPGLPLHLLPREQPGPGDKNRYRQTGRDITPEPAGNTQGQGVSPRPVRESHLKQAGSAPPILPAGSLCRVRFTLLEDRPFLQLAGYLLGIHRGVGLKLMGSPVTAKDVLVVPTAEDPWPGHADPLDLYEQATGGDTIGLIFASPTTFRRGDKNMPLPLPRLVFQGLYEKWHHFCPERPLKGDLLDFVDRYVFPSEFNIHTDTINYGKNALFVGFVGNCTFGMGRQVARIYPDYSRQLDLLARLAFYTGVGQKTTMGMGQCLKSTGKWVPPEGDKPAAL